MAKNRSLNKIGKEFDELVIDMKKMAGEYAKATGSKKQQLVNKLKDMTKKKKQLQSEMDTAVKAADKDVDLQIDEMTRLIRKEVTKLMKEKYGYIK